MIDEIMYHPPSENSAECWVELRNLSSNDVNLAGWRFSQGIPFSFPASARIPSGGYLVVAADASAFAKDYPGVTNVLAGWTGGIGAHLRLDDASGHTVSEVKYSNDGDWAARRLTSEGFASYGHLGWVWDAPHDGQGPSLELINPNLPINVGQNWGSSAVLGGTPGRPNSIAQADEAPLIESVSHRPSVPHSSDSVVVTARLVDESNQGLRATLFYRDATSASPLPFSSTPMLDDGQHQDGLASDGIYAAVLPPRPAGTVIEFYLTAQDAAGHERLYPNVIAPTNSLRTANLLYQVDDEQDADAQPVYRLVMTEMERKELHDLARGCPGSSPGASMDSDAEMNATWITTDGIVSGGTTTQVRYNAGVRNRGHGTRSSNPNNYHVNIPGDRPWEGKTGLNLNSQYAFSQVLGSAVFRRLGIPMPVSEAVQVRVNSTNLMSLPNLPDNNSFGSYAANEQYNNDFVKRAFALDPNGNSYRGIRDQTLCDSSRNSVADLSWHGADLSLPVYANAYFKQNNFLTNDGSDLLNLIAVLNSVNGYAPSNYVADVQQRLDVDEWMKYMAVNTLLDNDETCLANGTGDDYALYRGVQNPRFQALPYDLDTVFGRGNSSLPPRHSIFRMTALPVMDRFMKTPEFAPIYFKWLRQFATTAFSPAQMNPLIDQVLGGFVPATALDNMKSFNEAEAAFVLSQIPSALTVATTLPVQSGFPRTTASSVALSGQADAVATRSVLVNGSSADWSAWQGTWSANAPLTPGINRLIIQALDESGTEIARTELEVWSDDGTEQAVGGTIAADTTWAAASGPFRVTGNLTVADGATLTIQPGTSVYLNSGVSLTVSAGGRLLAEGTSAAPILFTGGPAASGSWGGLVLRGAVNSPENRIAYAHFEGNGTTAIEVAGGTIYLDHATFGTTTHQYLALDGSSFLVSNCVFPTSTAPFELVHGTEGIKTGGRGIVRDCFFGTTSGYNDIMDFTGGNRDLNQPIIQYYNNVFIGATDDILDLDGTDAWIEGNIFLHSHKNGSPDSSSGISGGDYDFGGGGGGVRTSEITIIGNLFYDCDQAATAKQGNFFTLLNNTIVHTTKAGGLDTASGVVNVRDLDPGPPTTFGTGMYLEGNIVVDAEQLVRNYDPAQTTVTFNRNILPFAWNGPGEGNVIADPLLKHIPQLSETDFTDWQSAQIMRDWFTLQPGSPARGSGPNGQDQGGAIPLGASVSGEPGAPTSQTSAVLSVGPLRTGSGIPTAGWPNGSGYTAYRWSLDGGPWSAETSTTVPITLTSLANGPHQVAISGKRDSGLFQDDPALGPDARVTLSRQWTIDTSLPPAAPAVRLNEILAANSSTLTNGTTTPDLVELFNPGSGPVDLSGMGVTNDPSLPHRFTFPPGTPVLGAGQFLVLYADSAAGATGLHLGFNLNASGDSLYLFAPAASGGSLLDSVTFGPQVPDFSIGRGSEGEWLLGRPTFGATNTPVGLGDPHHLKINEWLADEQFAGTHDFVELYNPDTIPVALAGCFLSNAEGAPGLNPLPALSFVAPGGYLSFVADGTAAPTGNHLSFHLDPSGGVILLSDTALEPIDVVNYGPQTTDVAQGRSPSGTDPIASFPQPTAGGPNPAANGGSNSITNITRNVSSVLDMSQTWRYDNSGQDLGTSWRNVGYDDSTWPSGTGLFGRETTPAEYPFPFRTTIPAPDQAGGHLTVYYRTHFPWNGSMDGLTLVATNYVDDGAVYYLNGTRVGALRMPDTVTATTQAANQPNEGQAELLTFTELPQVGDNVLAVEVHQANNTSSDDVFGLELSAVLSTTNIVTTTLAVVPVVLNEVLASNHSVTNLDGGTADWIELYNPSTNVADLADVSLSIDPSAPRQFVFGDGTVLPAGGTLVMNCDGRSPVSTTNTGFSLNAQGGSVYLFNKLANGGNLIDGLAYGLQTPDFSVARVPDGTGPWTLAVPSPRQPNRAAGLGPVEGVHINEWMADPSSGSDWFELYNSGALPVALGGLFLTSDLTSPTLSPLPPLSFIGSGSRGFVQFHADGSPGAGADHANFKLNKAGDAIGLFSATGTLLTAVTFGPQQTGVSQGRLPDGSDTIVSFPGTASPGASNFVSGGNPNDTNGDGIPDAWQVQHFGSLTDPRAAATADPDGDGFTNLQEYLAGTDPLNSTSNLRIASVEVDASGTVIRFNAVAGHAYRIRYRTDLGAGTWTTLTDIPAPAQDGPLSFHDPGSGKVRFYQILVP